MALVNRKRPKLGDVIEIPVGTDFAYAHYTHHHELPPKYGALLRVMPGTWRTRPDEFVEIVRLPPQFITFFPLGAACAKGIVHIVANEDIPAQSSKFPTFRSCVRTPDGRGPWWLWDGEKEWKVADLVSGMEELPLRGVVNDTLLVRRIAQGWRHANEV